MPSRSRLRRSASGSSGLSAADDEKRDDEEAVGVAVEDVRALGRVLLRPNDVKELARLFIMPPPLEAGTGRAAAEVAVEVGGVYGAEYADEREDVLGGVCVDVSALERGDEVLGDGDEETAEDSCVGDRGGEEGEANARINGSSSSTAARAVRFTLIDDE